MSHHSNRIFTGEEAAIAYALSAERIWGSDNVFLDCNPALVPVFVSQLFQSLEISIKHAGICSGLFTKAEARSPERRSGHGIEQLAMLAAERLGGRPFEPVVRAMTYFNTEVRSRQIVGRMIHGDEFKKTRECYASRRLGYGEVLEGDFALVTDISSWIQAVKQTAQHLPKTIDIVTKWKASPSHSDHFAIWLSAGDEADIG